MSVDAVAEKVRQSLRANDCNLDICDLVPCFCAQRAATAALDAIEVTEEVVEAAEDAFNKACGVIIKKLGNATLDEAMRAALAAALKVCRR